MQCSTVVDGAINRDTFDPFIEQVLLPELQLGDIVVMDDFSSHKGGRIAPMIIAAGAELRYLPPCSPDLNPIQLIFSKVKQGLRSLAHRTQALWNAMQGVVDTITPTDACNCYRHAGYTLQNG